MCGDKTHQAYTSLVFAMLLCLKKLIITPPYFLKISARGGGKGGGLFKGGWHLSHVSFSFNELEFYFG